MNAGAPRPRSTSEYCSRGAATLPVRWPHTTGPSSEAVARVRAISRDCWLSAHNGMGRARLWIGQRGVGVSRHRSSVGLVGAFAIVWLALCGCMTFADGAGAEEGTGLIEEFPISTIIRGSLEGMAPGPEGSMWFVQATGYQQPWGLIERMSPDGLLTGIFTTSIRPFYPTSIVSGPDGNMWFTDVAYNREVPDKIGRITPAGAIVEFPIPGPTSLNFVGPSAIAVGPDGNLWFTDLSEG